MPKCCFAGIRPKDESILKSIAILEYVCGGGFASESIDSASPSLLREGRAMLEALAEDWRQLPERSVHVAWDCRVGEWRVPNIVVHECDCQKSMVDTWLEIASQVDCVLVIAPELNDQLVKTITRLREFVPASMKVLNADQAFCVVASDKWSTSQCFAAGRIRHPETVLLNQVSSKADLPNSPTLKWIAKPRDGAGCESVVRFNCLADLEKSSALYERMSGAPHHWIVQPWLKGKSGSVAVLCGPKARLILPPMTQSIAMTNEENVENLKYQGGSGPWWPVEPKVMEGFVHLVLESIPPEPHGWIGIDFLVTKTARKEKELVAIEVNPRLTTSYLGVRTIVKENLAGLLESVTNGEQTEYSVRNSTVHFTPFGVSRPRELEFE